MIRSILYNPVARCFATTRARERWECRMRLRVQAVKAIGFYIGATAAGVGAIFALLYYSLMVVK